ncbi:hypothetical protein GJ496_008805 [Pomphorhynchus laevis]|nr:hypothetical protein GJ496_008805 [Pomphorhynchus laevis]
MIKHGRSAPYLQTCLITLCLIYECTASWSSKSIHLHLTQEFIFYNRNYNLITLKSTGEITFSNTNFNTQDDRSSVILAICNREFKVRLSYGQGIYSLRNVHLNLNYLSNVYQNLSNMNFTSLIKASILAEDIQAICTIWYNYQITVLRINYIFTNQTCNPENQSFRSGCCHSGHLMLPDGKLKPIDIYKSNHMFRHHQPKDIWTFTDILNYDQTQHEEYHRIDRSNPQCINNNNYDSSNSNIIVRLFDKLLQRYREIATENICCQLMYKDIHPNLYAVESGETVQPRMLNSCSCESINDMTKVNHNRFGCENGEPCPKFSVCKLQSNNLPSCQCPDGFFNQDERCHPVNCNLWYNCADDAFCSLDSITTQSRCRCKQGFVGDGYSCFKKTCIDHSECNSNARCVPDSDNRYMYYCICNPGYHGDGYTCKKDGNNVIFHSGFTYLIATFFIEENHLVLTYLIININKSFM